MANPYHDETGRFCSKGEMKAAIEKAQKAGNFDVYFQLRRDFEDIEQNRVRISKETLETLYGSEKFLEDIRTNDEARAVYDSIKPQLHDVESQRNHNFYSATTTIRAFLTNENVSEELKAELLADLPLEIKTALLQRDTSGGFHTKKYLPPQYALAVLKKGVNERYLHDMAYSDLYTFEQKYQEAQNHSAGLAILAANQPELFFKNQPLIDELHEKYETVADVNDKQTFEAAFAQSPHEVDQMVAAQSLDYRYRGAAQLLTDNKNLKPAPAAVLLENFLVKKPYDVQAVATSIVRNYKETNSARNKTIADRMVQATWHAETNVEPFPEKYAPYLDRIAELEKVEKRDVFQVDELDGLKALRDAHSPYDKDLDKSYKTALKVAKKRNATDEEKALANSLRLQVKQAQVFRVVTRMVKVLKNY